MLATHLFSKKKNIVGAKSNMASVTTLLSL